MSGHAYPLHVAIEAECWCCRSLQPFLFASASDPVVCTACSRHLGAEKAERRDLDHVQMWVELYRDSLDESRTLHEADAARAAASRTRIEDLESQVAALTGGVAGQYGESAAVRELIETEVLARAERKSALANRRTDRLMEVLVALDALHHDSAAAARCSCGKSVAVCAEWNAIEPQRSVIRAWASR